MNKTRLLVCPSCSRHVRASESACPFCDGGLPASLSQTPAPRAPSRRLSRAALYAFGAGGSLGLATACSGSSFSTEDASIEETSDVVAADHARVAPPYGIAPAPDAEGDQRVVAAYGGPIPPDAETDIGSVQPLYGASFDASIPIEDAEPDHLNSQPLYGASFDAAIPPYDAHAALDATDDGPRDAGHLHDAMTVVPAYGIAPPYGTPPHP